MTELTERRLGWGFGITGAVLVGLGGLLALLTAAFNLVGSHWGRAAFWGSTAVALFVLAGLAFFFAYLGYRSWSDRPVVCGVILVLLAVVGWIALGLGANVLALVGGLFVFLAGVLYLVEPAIRGFRGAISKS